MFIANLPKLHLYKRTINLEDNDDSESSIIASCIITAGALE